MELCIYSFLDLYDSEYYFIYGDIYGFISRPIYEVIYDLLYCMMYCIMYDLYGPINLFIFSLI